MKNIRTKLLVVFLSLFSSIASALVIDFTAISTPFNSPIGIDYYEPTNSIVVSVNYPNGSPNNFEIINQDGSHSQFSTISGLTDEVKIATSHNGSKFGSGTLFTGTGVNGQIIRINSDGSTHNIINLPGGNGLFRGSLFVDNTGVYNGDLIAVTTSGQVWRIDELGNGNLLADVNTHLEGLLVLPNDTTKWGAFAGRIIAGAENQSNLYTFDNAGHQSTEINLGVRIEDIDLISNNSNFFGVNFGTNRLLGAEASQWASVVGDVLLTQEVGGVSGLWTMSYNSISNQLVTEEILVGLSSFNPGQWEHVTFATAGIVEILPTTPNPPNPVSEPTSLVLLALGLVGFGFSRKKNLV